MTPNTRKEMQEISSIIIKEVKGVSRRKCENILLTFEIVAKVSQLFSKVKNEEERPQNLLKDPEFSRFQGYFQSYLSRQTAFLKNTIGLQNHITRYLESCKESMAKINNIYVPYADVYALQYIAILADKYFRQKIGIEEVVPGCNKGLISPDYSIICCESCRFILSQIYGELIYLE